MLGRRDIDKQENWSDDYKGEEYIATRINFISNIKNHGCRYMMNSPIHQLHDPW